MVAWTAYLASAVLVLIFVSILKKREKRNLPKGPWAWPLVGNEPQMRPIHKALGNWAKEFGDIFTVQFGRYRTIVLSSPELVRDAFNEPALAGKIDEEAFTMLTDGQHGVLNSEGQVWAEQRRFTLRHLRDFGFGKNTGEELITSEMKEFIQGLEVKVGKPISLNKSFGVASLNSLWKILAGVRYEQDDPRLWDIVNGNDEYLRRLGENPLLMTCSAIAKLAPRLSGWTAIKQILGKMRHVVAEHVDRHRKEFRPDENPRDFIDAYLKRIESTTDSSSSFYKDAGIRSLTAFVCDMFQAGADTTSLTLSWLMLHLAKFPDIQNKLHSELDEVVGKGKSPSLEDRPRMPYTEAVIAESMRMASLAPIGTFHRAMKDVKFHGYDIPKGTLIVANIHYIHYDTRNWDEPQEFRPERFLSADGKTVKKHAALMPFSIGKRQCLGETLARDTIFLYFTNIFHRFCIRLYEDSKDATLEPVVGFLLGPKDFKVVLKSAYRAYPKS